MIYLIFGEFFKSTIAQKTTGAGEFAARPATNTVTVQSSTTDIEGPLPHVTVAPDLLRLERGGRLPLGATDIVKKHERHDTYSTRRCPFPQGDPREPGEIGCGTLTSGLIVRAVVNRKPPTDRRFHPKHVFEHDIHEMLLDSISSIHAGARRNPVRSFCLK